eukprot:RCo023699
MHSPFPSVSGPSTTGRNSLALGLAVVRTSGGTVTCGPKERFSSRPADSCNPLAPGMSPGFNIAEATPYGPNLSWADIMDKHELFCTFRGAGLVASALCAALLACSREAIDTAPYDAASSATPTPSQTTTFSESSMFAPPQERPPTAVNDPYFLCMTEVQSEAPTQMTQPPNRIGRLRHRCDPAAHTLLSSERASAALTSASAFSSYVEPASCQWPLGTSPVLADGSYGGALTPCGRGPLPVPSISYLNDSLVMLVRTILLDGNFNPLRGSLPTEHVYHLVQIFSANLLRNLQLSYGLFPEFLKQFETEFRVERMEFEPGYSVRLAMPDVLRPGRVAGPRQGVLECLRHVVNALGYITVDGFIELMKGNPFFRNPRATGREFFMRRGDFVKLIKGNQFRVDRVEGNPIPLYLIRSESVSPAPPWPLSMPTFNFHPAS